MKTNRENRTSGFRRVAAGNALLGFCLASAMIGGAGLFSAAYAAEVPAEQTAPAKGAEMTITGTVIDDLGEPLIGVTVMEAGKPRSGTMTDLDGNYTIKARPGATLVFSYVGMTKQEVKVGSSNKIDVTMKSDSNVLDDVVVVGFGSQKKVNLTGSVATVDSSVFEDRPVTNAVQALQGAMPGLTITNNSGALDSSANINVRGTGTIGSSSGSPLILIDGMEGDINTVNPNDIENISVLKDAAASSIYGARAPFGVILVTTKKGKQGKATVTYTDNFRWGQPTRLPEMVNSLQFAEYYNTANRNAGAGNYFSDELMQRIADTVNGVPGAVEMIVDPSNPNRWQDAGWGKTSANTDWYDVVYKDWAFAQEHNLSLTGGTEKTNYYASMNYMYQSGLSNVRNDNLKRYSATGKFSAELFPWLRFDFSSRFIRKDYTKPRGLSGALYDNLSMNFWPTMPVYDPNGNEVYGSGPEILRIKRGGDLHSQNDDLYMQGAFIFEPIKNWVTHLELNYRVNQVSDRTEYLTWSTYEANGDVKSGYDGDTGVYNYHKRANYGNLNLFSEYSKSWGEHNGKVMVGFQAESYRQEITSMTAYGLIDQEYPWANLTTNTAGNGDDKWPTVGGYYDRWTTAGFFGRLNYDYAARYLAEVNLRYDGTSRFRRGSRWGLFPSFSVGWNLANEEFMEDARAWLTNLKVRGSYGELGNQNTNSWYPQYELLALSAQNGGWLQGGLQTNTALYPNSGGTHNMLSTYLTWEKIKNWNVGLDWGFFNNRLTGSFDYYQRTTTGMVSDGPELPAVLGANNPQTNNTNLRNYGFELQLNWNDRIGDFSYGVGVNFSDAYAKVIKYANNPTNELGKYIEGQLLGQIWGYETVGIANSKEEMQAHLDGIDENYKNSHNGEAPEMPGMGQSKFGGNWDAGDVMYADLNGDGHVDNGQNTLDDHGDLKVIGNSTPRYLIGINLNASWKGFDFSAFFQGVCKRDIWQSSWLFWGGTGDSRKSTVFTEHLDYWTEDNTDAYYPRPYFSYGGNAYAGDMHNNKNQVVQTRYLQNAAYLRCKNLQLGYSLPNSIIERIGLQKIRIYFSAENLFCITKMKKMFDPETVDGGNTGGKNRNIGEAYPLSKTFSFGVNITF